MSETQEIPVVKHNFPNGADEVRYEVVAQEEMGVLNPLFDKLDWPRPDPEFAKIVVVKAGTGDDALVLGFQVVEFICHAGQMWLNPHVRGTGIAEGLASQVMSYIERDCKIKRYISVAKPGSFGARLAERYGMVKVPQDLYMKNLP
jgi:hypothetical protein